MRSSLPLRAGLMLGAALIALAAGRPVAAQSDAETIAELRRQMQAMQRRLEALEQGAAAARPRPEAEQAVRRAREAERAARAAEQAAAASAASSRAALETARAAPPPALAAAAPRPVTEGTLPNSFRLPGTDTSVRLYGIIATSLTQDFGPRNRADVITAQAIPFNDSAASRQGGDVRLDARRTRFGLETATPTPYGPLRTLLEMDFAGVQSTASLVSQSNVSSFIPRLRQAYAELAGFTIGQTWSLMFDPTYGERLDYGTPNGINIGRQAQLRYTHRWANGFSLAGSVEAPYTDGTFSTGTRFDDSDALVAPFPNGTGTLATVSKSPDILARLRYENLEHGSIQLVGLVRPTLSINNRGDANPGTRYEDSVTGWGLQLSGTYRVTERDNIFGRIIYGEGIGRYLGATSNGQGFVSNALTAGVTPAQRRMDTVPVFAVAGGFTHYWTPTLRTNLLYTWAQLDYPAYVRSFSNAGRSVLNSVIQAGNVNLIWSPIPRVDLGIEYNYANRDLEVPLTDGTKGGTAHRLQFSGRFRF